MDVRLIWTDCDEVGDYVAPNVLTPRDLVSRPDNMDETVLHTFCAPRHVFEHERPDQHRRSELSHTFDPCLSIKKASLRRTI